MEPVDKDLNFIVAVKLRDEIAILSKKLKVNYWGCLETYFLVAWLYL
jgi:hypothetical protein